MNPGQYFHAGFKEGVINSLRSSAVDNNSVDKVQFFVNCDGASTSDNSPSVLWPILGRIINVTSSPFEIGIYHGPGKPSDFNQYLQQFTEEANFLIDNGLEYEGKIIAVEIHCFTCDAPALAAIKFIIQLGGYNSFTKCETKGCYVSNASGRGGRITFP